MSPSLESGFGNDLTLCMSGWLASGLENHSTVVSKVVNVANTKL